MSPTPRVLSSSFARHQRGAVLITSLLLLLAMTVLGITAMRGASLEERMALNASLRTRAFYAAESALREGIDQDTELAALVDSPVGTTSSAVTVSLGSTELHSQYEIQYLGATPGGPGAGSSISLGRDHFFEVKGSGEIRRDSTSLSSAKNATGIVYFMPDL